MEQQSIMNIYILLIIYFILFHYSTALFGSSLKQLREKASSLYKSRRKGVNLNYMGHVASDYPGTNPKYIKINEDNWEEYYSCLKLQQENLGKYLSMTPQAILGFEGASVKLDCRICISPLEKESKDLIKWEWAPIDGKHLEPVDFNENIVISPEDKTLHLYNLETSHSGQYFCVLGEASTTPYFLTIISFNESEIVEVHSPDAPLGPYPKDPEYLLEHGLVLDTEWSEWSTCSSCDKIGKRHKLGYCSIYSKDNRQLTVSIKLVNESVTYDYYSTVAENNSLISTTEKVASEQNEYGRISDADLELFSVFQFGIPCNSHILPQTIKNVPMVKNRKNEIMMGFCRVKCHKNEIFVVKDSHGNIIEKVNNSAGIYSLTQRLPPLEPPVARQLLYGVKGKTVILTCPGSMNTDAPIQWQIGNKNLVPEVIARESNKRIFISITDKIHITNSKIFDSNIYSCWQREELAGTIRLVVEKKIEFDFNHTVMLVCIIIIMAVFLKIFIKAIMGKKFAKV